MSTYLEARKSMTNLDAIRTSVVESGRAVILTSFILIAGFGLMMFSLFMPNVYFGVFSVIILAIALLADIIFLPSLLLLMGKTELVPVGRERLESDF
jgi:hypothetical protein